MPSGWCCTDTRVFGIFYFSLVSGLTYWELHMGSPITMCHPVCLLTCPLWIHIAPVFSSVFLSSSQMFNCMLLGLYLSLACLFTVSFPLFLHLYPHFSACPTLLPIRWRQQVFSECSLLFVNHFIMLSVAQTAAVIRNIGACLPDWIVTSWKTTVFIFTAMVILNVKLWFYELQDTWYGNISASVYMPFFCLGWMGNISKEKEKSAT
jgi:hypothetical protein